MKLLNRIKNRKGMTSLEISIGALIVIIVLTGIIDIATILGKLDAISYTSTYIADTITTQGGVRTSTPLNFRGDYVDSATLYNHVKKSLGAVGIENNNFDIKINGVTITPETNIKIYNFGEEMNISLSAKYNFALINNFIPVREQSKESKRRTISTFKVRNGSMETEY